MLHSSIGAAYGLASHETNHWSNGTSYCRSDLRSPGCSARGFFSSLSIGAHHAVVASWENWHSPNGKYAKVIPSAVTAPQTGVENE